MKQRKKDPIDRKKRKHDKLVTDYANQKSTHLEKLATKMLDELDITLNRKDMIQTLKQNLEIHELHEEYEGCARIAAAIKSIESNQK
jgi:protein-arginine kinase activator protein McsA